MIYSGGDGSAPSVRRVAQTIRGILGGNPSAQEFLNEDESSSIVIATFSEVPAVGWSTFTTAGLSDHPNFIDDSNVPVELMACASSSDLAMRNVLATAAFDISLSGWTAAPGVVFPHVVRDYFPSTSVPHMMWVEPFSEPSLSTVHAAGFPDLHWLQGVPINDDELKVMQTRGFDELDAILSNAKVEYFDLWRESTC